MSALAQLRTRYPRLMASFIPAALAGTLGLAVLGLTGLTTGCAGAQANESPVKVAVTPASALVNTGATAQLTASVSGSASAAVAWSVDGVTGGNATVGSLTGSGNSVTYTAPAASGTHTVVATSLASPAVTASATITVQGPAVQGAAVQVTLNPAGATALAPAGTLALTAAVTGSATTGVIWDANGVTGGNSTVGTFSGTGNSVTYTAPASPGSYAVTATSTADATRSASLTITVTAVTATAPSGSLALTPSAPTAVGSGGHLTFTAGAADGVTWSVDGIAGGNSAVGTIAAGVYTCPAVTSQTVRTITATTASATASVSILTVPSNTTVNAKTQYGATGNGSSDDTAAINSALAATGKGICYLPVGTYRINATAVSGRKGVVLNAGNTLLMAPGVVLQTITQSTSGEYNTIVMSTTGTANMAVVGGTIIGDQAARNIGDFENGTGTDFQNGNCIEIANGSGFTVLGTTTRNAVCDGIYICYGASNPSNIVIQDVTADNNRRQGLSVTGGTNILVKNSRFTNTHGQDPGLGIDLEPASSGQDVSNITITGCTLTGNACGGLAGGSPHESVDHVTVSNCTFDGNGGGNYGFAGIYFNDGASACTITNNTITNNKAGGNDGGLRLSGISSFTVTNNTITNNHGDGIYLSGTPGTTVTGNTVKGNSAVQIYNGGGQATVANNTTN